MAAEVAPDSHRFEARSAAHSDGASAARRLSLISSHVTSEAGPSCGCGAPAVSMTPAAEHFFQENGYAVILPERLKDGTWQVYRSARSPLQLIQHFGDECEHIQTLHDNFANSVAAYKSQPCLGTRAVKPDGTFGAYEWLTYAEAGLMRTAVGSGLLHLGCKPGSRVGIYMINSWEWIVTEQACNSYSMVTVPLYDTLGPNVVQYIINHAGIECVVCSHDKLDTMMKAWPECPTLRIVVVTRPTPKPFPSPDFTHSKDCAILSFRQLLQTGRSYPSPHHPPKPCDMATICYTSGTTGTPKGAVLTHLNLVSNAVGQLMMIKDMGAADVHISYLPLAHIYERVTLVNCLHSGTAVGFYSGDVQKLLDDISELKPTIFISVPRLWNRIYDKVMASVRNSSNMRQRLFQAAYAAKKRAIERGTQPSPIWDRLVFSKIRSALGGRVRLLGTGASPIAKEVFEFMQICLGGRVIEGYGMTEAACVITMTEDGDSTSGHVGSPNPACEIKLQDIPEMEYLTRDKPYPRGEICVRGPIVFKEYYKDAAQTAEVIDAEGWLHTGDIGLWLPGGRLKIIDRKKNIFKLAQGEYIAPEKIENAYMRCPLVAQVFVHGDSLTSFLVGIVVPEQEELVKWSRNTGIGNADDFKALCADPEVKAAVLNAMHATAKEAQMRGFEQVKDIHLTPELFSVENELLTPTFKVRRAQAVHVFEAQIKEMYARNSADSNGGSTL